MDLPRIQVACKGCKATVVIDAGAETRVCEWCGRVCGRPSRAVDPGALEELLSEGDRLCNNMEFEEARYYYRRAKDLAPDNPEPYWGLIRCRFGVQVVYEDMTDERYVLTTFRVKQPIDVMHEYHELLRVCGGNRNLYRSSVSSIREQQKQMRELWNQGEEMEYDVYLCYKETERIDKSNKRGSKDREWVRAFYEALERQQESSEKKLKIFYAPVSLKNATGAPYAAHISHALSTAKVMLLMGTQAEYFDTSWVLSERTRFNHYISHDGQERIIIPVFNTSLMGGRSMEDVFPGDITRIQGNDVSGGLDEAAALILSKCRSQLNKADPDCVYRHDPAVRKLEAVKRDLVRIGQEKRDLETENQIERAARERAEKDAAEARNRLDGTLRDLQRANDDLKSAETEADRKIDAATNPLKSQLEKMKADADDKGHVIQYLQKEIVRLSTLQDELRKLESAGREQEKEKETLRRDLERALSENAQLDSEKLRLEKAVEEIKAEARAFEEEAGRLREKAAQSRAPAPKLKLNGYGFLQTDSSGGRVRLGADLTAGTPDRDAIEAVYLILRSMDEKKTLPVTVSVAGFDGRFSEKREVRIRPRMASELTFPVRDPSLTRRTGTCLVTVTGAGGAVLLKEEIQLKGC